MKFVQAIRDSLVRRRTRIGLLCGFAFVALLFWARLIVITDMPRTAIAGPEDEAPVVDAADATPGAPREVGSDGRSSHKDATREDESADASDVGENGPGGNGARHPGVATGAD